MPDYVLPSISPDLPIQDNPLRQGASPSIPDLSLPKQGGSDTPITNMGDSLGNALSGTKPSPQLSFADWDEQNAGRYVGKPHYDVLGHNAALGPQYNEEKYANAQTGWEQFKNATWGGFMGAGHAFVDQFKSWKDVASVLQDGNLTAAFQKDELDAIADRERDFQNSYPIYQSKNDQESFFSWGNFYKQLQGVGPLVGSVAEMVAENAATMALIGYSGGALAPLAEVEATRDAAFIARATNNAIREGVTLTNTIDKTANVKRAFAAYSEAPSFKTALPSATAWMGENIGRPIGETVSSLSNLLPGSNTAKLVGTGLVDLGTGTADLARSSARVRAVTKGVGALYMDLRDLNLSISMAQGNASGTYHSMVDEWSRNFKDKKGRDATPDELSSIEDQALQASKTTGALAAMAMLYTNKLAFGNILRGNNALKQIVAEQGSGLFKGVSVVPEFLRKEGEDKLLANSKWYNYRSLVAAVPNAIGHGLGFGLTMSGAAAITEASKAYFNAKYDHKDIEWVDAFKKGIDEQFTKAGAQTFISGFLTGAITGKPMEALPKIFENSDRFTNNTGFKQRIADQKLETQEFVKKYNEFYNDSLSPIKESIANLNTQLGFKAGINLATHLKSTKLFNDLHDDALRQFMVPAIRNGHMDLYLDHLKDFTENLTPKELFQAIHPELKYEDNRDLAQAFYSHITEFQGRAKDLDRIYKDVYRKFPNPFNPYKYKEGDPKFEKERGNYIGFQHAIDFTVFGKDVVQRSLERQSKILNGDTNDKGIRGMEIFKNVGFSTLYNFTDPIYLKGSIETLQQEVSSALTNTDKLLAEQQLKAHQEYFDHLTDYKSKYQEILSLKGEERVTAEKKLDAEYTEKLKEPFSKVLNHELKEKGQVISDVDKDSAISKYLDYYKLSVEADGQLKFYNVVIDPKGNWGEYTQAVTRAYKEHVQEQKESKKQTREKDVVNNTYKVDDNEYKTTSVDEDGTVHYETTDKDGNTIQGKWSKEEFKNIQGSIHQEPPSFTELRKVEEIRVRKEAEFNTQKTHFENLVKGTEDKLMETRARKIANEEEFKQSIKDIDDLKKALDVHNILAQEDIEKFGGLKDSYKGKDFSKTKVGKELKKTIENLAKTKKELSIRLDNLESTLDHLSIEKEELSKQEEALKEARELQKKFLDRLEEKQKAYNTQATKRFTSRLENREQDILEHPLTRKPERVEQLLKDTKDEIAQIEQRRELLIDTITAGRDFLSKINGLERLYDELLVQAKNGNLKKFLWDIRNGKEWIDINRPETARIAIELLKTSTKPGEETAGIQRAYINEVIRRVIDASEEFESISKKRDSLLEKEERLETVRDQNVELTSLQDRLDYLHELQGVLDTLPETVLPITTRRFEWDEEKDNFERANKDKDGRSITTDQEVDNNQPFFTESFEPKSKPLFYRGITFRTVGRHYDVEHFDILDNHPEGGKLFIDRSEKNKPFIGVLDKTRFTSTRAKELQELANFLGGDPELLKLEEDLKTEIQYQGKPLEITRYNNDTQLNTLEKTAEAYNMSANISIDKIGGSIVTGDNDTYGIRNTQAFDDDIKVIYIDPSTKKPINVNGNIIDKPTKDNIVYRSLQGWTGLLDHSKLPAFLENPKDLKGTQQAEAYKKLREFEKSEVFDSMKFLFDIPKEKGQYTPETLIDVFNEAKEFKHFREKVKEEVKQNGLAHIEFTGKSQGIPNLLPKVNGKVQKHSVENRIVEKDTDWSSPKAPNGMGIALKISNSSDKSTAGIKNGRLVWVREDGQKLPGENRALSEGEKKNIVQALKYYSRFYNKEHEQLVQERGEKEATRVSNDMDRLRMLFNSTLFWGVPSKKDIDSGKVGKNRIWNVGDTLFRNNSDGTISKMLFIPSELDKISNQSTLLDGIFHQVNKKLLERNQPFDHYTISEKDGSYSIDSEPYDNYLHYLTSKADEEGVPVVYTNIVEHVEPKDGEPLTLSTSLKQVNLQFRNDYEYIPTPQQAERNKVEIDLPEEDTTETPDTPTPTEGIDVPESMFSFLEEEIANPEGTVEELGGGITKHSVEMPGVGRVEFYSLEGGVVTEQDVPGKGPKLFQDAPEVEATTDAVEPLVTTEPIVPEEPPKEEAAETEEVETTTNEEKVVSLPDVSEQAKKDLFVDTDMTEEQARKILGDDFNICDTGINF